MVGILSRKKGRVLDEQLPRYGALISRKGGGGGGSGLGFEGLIDFRLCRV